MLQRLLVGEKSYPMILEDEAGYYAVMLPLKRIPEYPFPCDKRKQERDFLEL